MFFIKDIFLLFKDSINFNVNTWHSIKRYRISNYFYKKRFFKEWRKRNCHNKIYLSQLCDMDKIKVGKGSYGNLYVDTITPFDVKLSIGNYCSISYGCKFLLGCEHKLNTISTYPFKVEICGIEREAGCKGDIIIDDDVWIGANSIICSGIHINRGCVIAAGSVVTNDVPPYAIVGGVPAKVIKYRFNKVLIDELMKIDYSKLSDALIKEHLGDLYEPLVSIDQIDWLPKK